MILCDGCRRPLPEIEALHPDGQGLAHEEVMLCPECLHDWEAAHARSGVSFTELACDDMEQPQPTEHK